jgi:glutamyl/glutaminyl-tRNA synthetase
LFDFKDIRPVAPIFDLKKLDWMNGIYIREVLSSEELIQRLYAFDHSLQKIDAEMFTNLVAIAKTRIKTLKEFILMIAPFLHPLERKLDKEQKEILDAIALELRQLPVWDQDSIASVILEKFIKTKRVSFKDLYTMLINTDKGLPLADTFAAIGKEKTLALFHE